MFSLVNSVFYFHNYFTDNKNKSSNKMWSSTHNKVLRAHPPHLCFHCQAACARPSPALTQTQVTWGRGCLRACASQADRDQPVPAAVGLHPRWKPRLRLRRQPGLGLGPGPPGMALRPSQGDGSAGRWNCGLGKAGTESSGLGRGPRSGRGLRGAATDEEEPGLALAAARHVRRAGRLC